MCKHEGKDALRCVCRNGKEAEKEKCVWGHEWSERKGKSKCSSDAVPSIVGGFVILLLLKCSS